VINLKGELVVPYQYHFIGPFSEGLASARYARVVHNSTGDHELLGPWGFINKEERMVIKPQFNDTDVGSAAVPEFHHGLAWIKNDITKGPAIPDSEIAGDGSEVPGTVVGETAGYINEKGQWVWKHTTMYKPVVQQGGKTQ